MHVNELGIPAEPVTASARGARRRPAADTPSFGTQIAAFYPYPQAPVDRQPRGAQATDPRERAATVADASALRRRRHGRGD